MYWVCSVIGLHRMGERFKADCLLVDRPSEWVRFPSHPELVKEFAGVKE